MLGRSWVGSGSADASEIEISLARNADLEVQTARKRSVLHLLPMEVRAHAHADSNGALTRAGACRSSSGCTAAPRLDPEVRQVRRMHRQSVREAAGTCRRKKTCRDWLCYFFLFECERPRQHRRRPLEVLHADERRMRSPASPEESWALSRTQEGRATTVLMRAARSTLRRGVKRKSLSPLSIRPTAA